MANNHKTLTLQARESLFASLEARFEKNKNRHPNLTWAHLQVKLESILPEKLWSLNEMERTQGEPDVLAYDPRRNEYTFYDCAEESPKARRSLCYDRQAQHDRKENQPDGNVLDAAAAMGIELLTETQYRYLQTLGSFDNKTSSWVVTPDDVRKLGGALFCDRRYGRVFVYHNGAQSYYAARGFRGALII